MVASSLFHFTKKLKTVIDIISSRNFRASYNIEDISDYYPNQKYVAVPMVCFCDIPLKFISEHPMNYGTYGIGLKKEWGIKNSINPILYRTDSQINKYIEDIVTATNVSTVGISNTFSLTLIKDNVHRLLNYSKKYQVGTTINYLDREWRFVPTIAEIPFVKVNSKKEKEILNEVYFKGHPDCVPFTLNDIKYIIVQTKQEVETLMKSIQTLEIGTEEKNSLNQLIVYLDSIKADF